MEPDEKKTLEATEALQKANPGYRCPFCQSEDTFIRQVRSDGSEHALAIYDPDSREIKSAYPIDLLTCYECGYCMPFLGEMLDSYLERTRRQTGNVDQDGDNHADKP